MMREKERLGRAGSGSTSENRKDNRSHLEVCRSIRRLSEGASGEFRKILRKDSSHLPVWNRTKRENRSSQTYVSCLIDDLSWALRFLEAPTDWKHVEELAVFIHETQSCSTRGFHNVERAFEVTGGASPVQMIAAFLRDTVIHFVDGGLNDKQKEMLGGVFLPNTFKVSPEFLKDDMFIMVTELFGVRTSESLDKQFRIGRGMDILLSAIITVKFLRDCLPKAKLAQIIVCMERTIPFRSRDDLGRTVSDRSYSRLVQANQKYSLGMVEAELELTCQMAVDLSNRILGVYAAADPDKFIAQTWALLPELYTPLRLTNLYSLDDYYFAVRDFQRFVEAVDPSIYDSFRGIPKEAEIIDFQKAFVKNQSVGAAYLKMKVVEVAMVTAFATITGGAKIPKAMFYGDLGCPRHIVPALGESLPRMDPRKIARNGCYIETYNMMFKPRTSEVSFDHNDAPVAAYIYGNIGEVASKAIFEKCVYPLTEETSWVLLKAFPYDISEVIARELGQIAPSRADFLEDVLEKLKNLG